MAAYTFFTLWRERDRAGHWTDHAQPHHHEDPDTASRMHQAASGGNWITAGIYDPAITDLYAPDGRRVRRGGPLGDQEPPPDGMTGREWAAAQMRRFLDNSSLEGA